jgi:hypothetical protein
MSPFAPLLAAGDAELVKLVIIIVFGVLVGIGKFYAMMKKGQPPAAMGQRPIPPPPVNVNAANEIEEFMRRAAAKPRPAANAGPVRRPPQPQLRQPVENPVQARVITDEPVGAKIGKQVEQDLDTQEFTKRSTQLGSEVAHADREIDQRMHQVFDHHVSNLELMPGESAAPPLVVTPLELTEQSLLDIPATFATGLTDLLADPDSVRQAIVLNEILHRPEERW